MRPIDADYVKSKLNKSALGGHLHYYVCGVIDDAPTIEAEPVKHGEWEDVKFSEGVYKDNDDSNDIGLSHQLNAACAKDILRCYNNIDLRCQHIARIAVQKWTVRANEQQTREYLP